MGFIRWFLRLFGSQRPRQCINCKYWARDPSWVPSSAECHRYPPKLATRTRYTSWMQHPDYRETTTSTEWPYTEATHSCGEFKYRK